MIISEDLVEATLVFKQGSHLSQEFYKAYENGEPIGTIVICGNLVGWFRVVSCVIDDCNCTRIYQVRRVSKEQDQKDQTLEDLYKGYVVKDNISGYYVGPDSDRCAVILRSHAGRFTKKEALVYIKNPTFMKSTNFSIEDAT